MSNLPTLMRKGFLKIPDLPDEVPVEYIINFLAEMEKSKSPGGKMLILVATTGSGKSSTFPAELYLAMTGEKKDKIIAVAQPRIFNAISIPTDSVVPYYPKLKMSENIGYKTGDARVTAKSGIMYMTTGSLLVQLQDMEDEDVCKTFSYVIIDEAHEKSEIALFIEFYIKKFLERCYKRPDCPLFVITSATINPEEFMSYYKTDNFIRVTGFTYEIQENFLEYSSRDYIADTIKIAETIVKDEAKNKTNEKDIIIFAAGAGEMKAFINAAMNNRVLKKCKIISINRDVVSKDYASVEQAFRPISSLKVDQKIIIATNVAETGLTFPYLKHVIDMGFYKSNEFIPDMCFKSLITKPITLYAYYQRRGRVGRRFPGICHSVYTEETKKALSREIVPEIYKSDISKLMLNLIAVMPRVKTILDFVNLDLINKPALASVWRAAEKLYILGFINSKFELTKLGEIANKFMKLTVEQCKVILSAYVWRAPVEDAIILAAALDQDKIKGNASEFAKLSCCDFLPFVELWHKAKKHGFDREEMENVGINSSVIAGISKFRDDVIIELGRFGLNPFANHNKCFTLCDDYVDYCKLMKRCLYEGLKLNVATWSGGMYTTKQGFAVEKKFPTAVSCFMYNKLEVFFTPEFREKKVGLTSILDGFLIPDVRFY